MFGYPQYAGQPIYATDATTRMSLIDLDLFGRFFDVQTLTTLGFLTQTTVDLTPTLTAVISYNANYNVTAAAQAAADASWAAAWSDAKLNIAMEDRLRKNLMSPAISPGAGYPGVAAAPQIYRNSNWGTLSSENSGSLRLVEGSSDGWVALSADDFAPVYTDSIYADG